MLFWLTERQSGLLESRSVRDALQVTTDELQLLSGAAFMGEVVSVHDLRLVLETIRSAQESQPVPAAGEADESAPPSPPESAGRKASATP